MPNGTNRQASSEKYSTSLSAAAASIMARCRPEYSSTIASCTMVSSRCVAGLSIGMRAFSAIATQHEGDQRKAERDAQPDRRQSTNVSAMAESWVVPAISATVNTTSSIAGSASEAIIISREEPMPPNAVPTSMPASASAKRPVASSATIAMRSADQENIRLVA